MKRGRMIIASSSISSSAGQVVESSGVNGHRAYAGPMIGGHHISPHEVDLQT